jgi:hypothetical protein
MTYNNVSNTRTPILYQHIGREERTIGKGDPQIVDVYKRVPIRGTRGVFQEWYHNLDRNSVISMNNTPSQQQAATAKSKRQAAVTSGSYTNNSEVVSQKVYITQGEVIKAAQGKVNEVIKEYFDKAKNRNRAELMKVMDLRQPADERLADNLRYFAKYYPTYSYLNEEERKAFIILADNGKLGEISCKI